MSHVATVDIEIRDLDDLDSACKRIGLELVRNQKTYRWFGTHVGDYPVPEGFTVEDLGKCEHAIRVADPKFAHSAYEIGVVRRRDGRPGYTLMWDFFAGGCGLQQFAGENCNTLKQSYALCAAKRQMQRQGLTNIHERQLKDGQIQLVGTPM